MVQGGTTAMHTLDNNGDERQLSLLVRQWPHHGALAGPPHLSLLHATGIATLTPHGLLRSACKRCACLHVCLAGINIVSMPGLPQTATGC